MDPAFLEQRLTDQARFRISDGYFPGCVIGVVRRDGKRILVPAGHFTHESGSPAVTEDAIYDMASVTKSIPTASLLLKLIDEGKLGLDDPVIAYVPELSIRERNNILVRHLLEFTLDYENPEYALQGIKYKSADEILKFLFTAEMSRPPGACYFYTNATAMLTGLVVERVTEKSLDTVSEETFFHPLGMATTSFRPEKLSQEKIVPTEVDPWRGREVRAEVHDESAWTLRRNKNMCVGSAGLFSSAPDMLTFIEMLLNQGTLGEKRYFSEAIVKQMHTNQLSSIGEFQGLGWKMGRSWMGSRYSQNAFGMTGFTGTSVFCDPDHNVGIVILSNGVYPSRENAVKGDLRDKFRAEILDIVLEHV